MSNRTPMIYIPHETVRSFLKSKKRIHRPNDELKRLKPDESITQKFLRDPKYAQSLEESLKKGYQRFQERLRIVDKIKEIESRHDFVIKRGEKRYQLSMRGRYNKSGVEKERLHLSDALKLVEKTNLKIPDWQIFYCNPGYVEFFLGQRRFFVCRGGVFEVKEDMLLPLRKLLDEIRNLTRTMTGSNIQEVYKFIDRFFENATVPSTENEFKSGNYKWLEKGFKYFSQNYPAHFERLKKVRERIIKENRGVIPLFAFKAIKLNEGFINKRETTRANAEVADIRGFDIDGYKTIIETNDAIIEMLYSRERRDLKSVVQYRRNCEPRMTSIEYENEVKTVKRFVKGAIFIDVFNRKGTRISYDRPSQGGVKTAKMERFFCNKKGQPIFFHSIESSPKDVPLHYGIVYRSNGLEMRLYDFEMEKKRRNGRLSVDEYMSEFKMAIKTKEDFLYFYRHFHLWETRDNRVPNELMNGIRKYGKEILGINVRIASLKKKYGFGKIDIDLSHFLLKTKLIEIYLNLPPKLMIKNSVKFFESSILYIDTMLQTIESQFKIYPPGMIKRMRNHRLILCSAKGIGGMVTPYGWIFLATDVASTVHHELNHHFYSNDPLRSARKFFSFNGWALKIYGEDHRFRYINAFKTDRSIGPQTERARAVLDDLKNRKREFHNGVPSRSWINDKLAELTGVEGFGNTIILRGMKVANNNVSPEVTTKKRELFKRYFPHEVFKNSNSQNLALLKAIAMQIDSEWFCDFVRPYPLSRGFKWSMIYEDMATVAEGMFQKKTYDDLMRKAKRCEYMSKKVRLMKDFYYVVSEGKMDDKFWADISRGITIDEQYWRKRDHAAGLNPNEYIRKPDLDLRIMESKRRPVVIKSKWLPQIRSLPKYPHY